MYCTKCGRRIDYEAYVCDECRAEEAKRAEDVVINNEPAVSREINKEDCCSWGTGRFEYTEGTQSYNTYNGSVPQTVAPIIEQTSEGNPRMAGFGKALTAVIFIVPEFIFFYLMALTMEFSSMCILFFFASVGFAIPSVIMGASSLRFAIKQKNSGKPTPIATMVCGIVALAESAFMLLALLFIAFIFLIALMFIMAY